MVRLTTLIFIMIACSQALAGTVAPISDEFNEPIDYLNNNTSVWTVLGANSMDERADVIVAYQSKLTIIPEVFSQNAWFENEYGPLVYQMVNGNFAVATRLRVMSDSDYYQSPNLGYNAGGFVIRDPIGTHNNDENWVMYNMGGQGMNGTTYAREVKKTVNSSSNLFLTAQLDLESYLLVCRIDDAFYFYYWATAIQDWREEHYYNAYQLDGTKTSTWHNAINVTPELTLPGPQQSQPLFFQHDQMPDTVQVGIMGHTWSNGNTQVDFDFVHFANQQPVIKADCLAEFQNIDVLFQNGLE